MTTSENGQRRRRASKIIRNAGDNVLLYDLERTFIFEVPEALQSKINCDADITPELGSDLWQWLIAEDLLTTAPTASRADPDTRPLPKLTDVSIDMSGACNMGCSYCFEKDIGSRTGAMSLETARATLDFIFRETMDAKRIALHFGSGEPLMRFDLLQWIVAEATSRAESCEKSIVFDLTTNASLVTDEIADFLATHPFSVRVSCDGPSSLHNAQRPMLGGQNSYDNVKRGLDRLLKHIPEKLTVNSVLCTGNRLADLWQWAKDIGLRHYHVIKVGAFEGNQNLQIDDLHQYRADLLSVSDDIFAELSQSSVPIDFQPITKIVRRLMIPEPITRFCGVAGSYLGVSSKGDVYPCFRHLGLKDYHIGSIHTKISDETRQRFLRTEAADVDSRPICNSCWARYLCGGGCYADSSVYGVDKAAPQIEHCPFWQSEIEAAIRLYDRIRRADPQWCLRLFGDDLDQFFDERPPSHPSFATRRNCQ